MDEKYTRIKALAVITLLILKFKIEVSSIWTASARYLYVMSHV